MAEYISKQAFKEKYLCCGWLPEMSEEEFNSFPAADVVEMRHGRWMDAESDGGCTVWHCSACSCPVKTIGGYPIYRHCPMCGARMDKEKT